MYKKIIKLFSKFNKSMNIINRVHLILEVKIKSDKLLTLALTSNNKLIEPCKKNEKELIVSLTTYSKRIHDVHLVIESIALQTVKPSRVILWLDENEFSLETIPSILKNQMDRGLEIDFCPNYRSYKKLIPTLKKYPDANIITIDDDTLYPYDMVEILCKEHKQYPDCIISNRVHKIMHDKSGVLLPYRHWEHGVSDSSATFNHIAIGIGGILYPVGSLGDECLNVDNFMNIAPHADDICFKAMSMLEGWKHKKTTDDRNFNERFLTIDGSQDIGLFNFNFIENGNDPQIKSIFAHYSLFDKLEVSSHKGG